MRSYAEKVAYTSALVCVAMLLSYLESFLPVIPIPGFKPGLANLAVMVAFYRLGAHYAASVSLIRIFLSSLLFGSPVSLVFSLAGGVLSFVTLLICNILLNRCVGLIGIGVLCAAAHCIGQCIAASALYGASLLLSYLPWLLLLSIATGMLTGALSHAVLIRIKTVSRKHPRIHGQKD